MVTKYVFHYAVILLYAKRIVICLVSNYCYFALVPIRFVLQNLK